MTSKLRLLMHAYAYMYVHILMGLHRFCTGRVGQLACLVSNVAAFSFPTWRNPAEIAWQTGRPTIQHANRMTCRIFPSMGAASNACPVTGSDVSRGLFSKRPPRQCAYSGTGTP